MADTVALGIIGYGIMGERLLRAALEHGSASVRVGGVWDPSPAAMERLAADFPDVPQAASVASVIDESACVYVAAPPSAHLDHARAVLSAGRALFCEKPLAVDVEKARAFVRDAEAAGMRAAVNFPFASSPAVERLEAWMADGTTGRVQAVDIEIAFATWPRAWQADAAAWLDRTLQGGFAREVLSHFVFLVTRMFGAPTLGAASVRFPIDGASERALAAELTCGTVPVRIRAGVGTTDREDTNTTTIHGSAGTIRLRDWSIAERRDADGVWQPDPEARPQAEMRATVLARQLEKVAAMTAGRRTDLASLGEALAVQETIEAILRSGK